MRPIPLLRWRVRRLTAPLRALPDFIVIGAPRAGTTTIYRMIAQHPRMEPASSQEVHFFNRTPTYGRGLGYYRAFFPRKSTLRRRGKITGEGTSVYMFRPNTAERIKADLPGIQLIAVLRDPVERAIASWEAFTNLGDETRPLLDALTEEIETLGPGDTTPLEPAEVTDEPHPAHVHKGRYADQLGRWIRLFPRDSLLIVFSEELFASPQVEFDRVADHLGLESHTVIPPKPAAGLRTEEADKAREILRSYYEAPDRALEDLLGRKLPWRGSQT